MSKRWFSFYMGRWYVYARRRPFRLRAKRLAPSSVRQVAEARRTDPPAEEE